MDDALRILNQFLEQAGEEPNQWDAQLLARYAKPYFDLNVYQTFLNGNTALSDLVWLSGEIPGDFIPLKDYSIAERHNVVCLDGETIRAGLRVAGYMVGTRLRNALSRIAPEDLKAHRVHIHTFTDTRAIPGPKGIPLLRGSASLNIGTLRSEEPKGPPRGENVPRESRIIDSTNRPPEE